MIRKLHPWYYCHCPVLVPVPLDKYQFISINSCNSTKVPVTCGVPQGSMLGPLRFILYMTPLGQILSRHGFQFHCWKVLYTCTSEVLLLKMYWYVLGDENRMKCCHGVNKLGFGMDLSLYYFLPIWWKNVPVAVVNMICLILKNDLKFSCILST